LLRGILEDNRDEVTGGWDKLCNEEFLGSTRQRMLRIKAMKWEGHVARVKGDCIHCIVRRKEYSAEQDLGWLDNTKMYFKLMG
jgi:hypothetical protein